MTAEKSLDLSRVPLYAEMLASKNVTSASDLFGDPLPWGCRELLRLFRCWVQVVFFVGISEASILMLLTF